MNLHQNDGKIWLQSNHCGASVEVWACVAANEMGSLVFIEAVTAHRSSE